VCFVTGRQQVSRVVRVDSSQDHPAAGARVESRLPVALAAPGRVAAASALQHARLPRDAVRQAVRPRRRQGFGRARGAV